MLTYNCYRYFAVWGRQAVGWRT